MLGPAVTDSICPYDIVAPYKLITDSKNPGHFFDTHLIGQIIDNETGIHVVQEFNRLMTIDGSLLLSIDK